MASPRRIRKRIVAIRNIDKITGTMERVAQSRAMKLQARLTGARAFRDRVTHLIAAAVRCDPTAADELAAHRLARAPREARATLLVVVSSNRGLCGGYNARVLHAARGRAAEIEAAGAEAIFAVIGRRGAGSLRYAGRPAAFAADDVDEATPYARWNELMSELIGRFAAGGLAAVEVVSTRYRSRAVQEVAVSRLLPFGPPAPAAAAGGGLIYRVEPSARELLGEAVALAVRSELTCLLVEAMLSEQILRTAAMRNATDSAEGMVKKLTRAYNRARQAQVTAEMMEIVAGSLRALEE